ncbi:MAG: FxsA family protein [Candidatus Brocadiia bacterium]
MLLKLILLLTVVPLLELLLLVRLTPLWGGFTVTVAVVVVTGLVGAVLARLEGLRVIGRMQEEMRQGRLPTDSLLDGVMILVAAALLVTPGLITDTVGFLLLIPSTRAVARGMVKAWIRRKIEAGEVRMYHQEGFRPIDEEPPEGYPPIEGED